MSKKKNQPSQTPPKQPAADSITGARSAAIESSELHTPQSKIARYVSFGLLLGVIGLVGFVFFEVMLSFLIPLFLAAILVVVFRPLHRWFLEKCGGRERLSAGLTTVAVLLAVLVPICTLLLMAVVEGRDVVQQFNAAKVEDGIRTIRKNLRLDMPAARQIRDIETRLQELQQTVVLDDQEIDQHRSSLYEIQESAKSLGAEIGREWPAENLRSESNTGPADQQSVADSEAANEFAIGNRPQKTNGLAKDIVTDAAEKEFGADANSLESATDVNNHWLQFCLSLQRTRKLHFSSTLTRTPSETEEISRKRSEKIHDYQNLINDTAEHFSDFKARLLGGKTRAWLAEMVNPTDQEFETYAATTISYVRQRLFSLGGGAFAFLGNTMVGFAIMIIGLYFFLLDGPGMIATLQKLSPIDDEHEQELVTEFGKVSRAVVVATLLSALVQGALAGIGFYFVGLESIFLLTVLSAVLAMVPFVGAAAVWVPCCFYVYFFEDNLTGAIVLAIYGAAVISMADNVIKPFVLHGQSNLHPLLALLSVLGGVTTLGPIGILVGPMIVAFLQTLLKILQREIAAIESA